MKNVTFVPHTGDASLKIQADSLFELFRAALDGINRLMDYTVCERAGNNNIKYDLSLEATNITELLINFLSEVLTRTQIEKTVFCEIKFKKLTEVSLEAQLCGRRTTSVGREVKAVTHHQADVNKINKKDWEAKVIFDI